MLVTFLRGHFAACLVVSFREDSFSMGKSVKPQTHKQAFLPKSLLFFLFFSAVQLPSLLTIMTAPMRNFSLLTIWSFRSRRNVLMSNNFLLIIKQVRLNITRWWRNKQRSYHSSGSQGVARGAAATGARSKQRWRHGGLDAATSSGSNERHEQGWRNSRFAFLFVKRIAREELVQLDLRR